MLENKQSTLLPMIIIGVLFFLFGFVTWLNGSLIPFLKIICDLNEFEALWVTFAFYIAYTVMAFPMSFILNKVGYKNGMAFGLFIMIIGSLLFIPASLSAEFWIFLLALFILGTGLTILQTASNPYVVHIGDIKSAARRISIMGLINKIAGVLVPLLFTSLILGDFSGFSSQSLNKEDISVLSHRLIQPYIIMAIVLSGLIALVKFSSLPELSIKSEEESNKNTIFAFPRVVLGAIALFAYVGVEVIAGDTIGLYGQQLGLNHFTAFTSFTMFFMVLGYIIGVLFIPKYLSQEKALILSALAGIIMVFGVIFSSTEEFDISSFLWGWSGIYLIPNSVVFVALMGLAHALVWPTIWPLALKNLGQYTAQGSALLIMGIAGGAILPLLFGKLAHYMGNMQIAYSIAIIAYLYILFYALKGHKLQSWSK
jgi:glucose/galactose transporter